MSGGDEAEQSAGDLHNKKVQYQDLAFKVFAVVGFISSIVTLVSWLSATQASLAFEVDQTSIEVPSPVQVADLSGKEYELESAIKDLRNRYCNPVEVDYSGDQTKNYFYSAEKCDESEVLFSAINKIAELAGKKLVAWDAIVKNEGSEVAENVTLRSPVSVEVRARDDDGNVLPVEGTPSGRVFSLANLNPGESINLRLVSITPVPEQFDRELDTPRVTFSGGKATDREFLRISGRYAGIVKFLDGIPTIAQIFVVLVAAFFITLIWLYPAALISDANDKRKDKSG